MVRVSSPQLIRGMGNVVNSPSEVRGPKTTFGVFWFPQNALFAPICRCVEFVKQCFMSCLGARFRFGGKCPQPQCITAPLIADYNWIINLTRDLENEPKTIDRTANYPSLEYTLVGNCQGPLSPWRHRSRRNSQRRRHWSKAIRSITGPAAAASLQASAMLRIYRTLYIQGQPSDVRRAEAAVGFGRRKRTPPPARGARERFKLPSGALDTNVFPGPDLGDKGPGLSPPTDGLHQTVSLLFLANDRCLRDYDSVVAHCWSLF